MSPRRIQSYETDAINRYFEYSKNLEQMVHVTIQGIHALVEQSYEARIRELCITHVEGIRFEKLTAKWAQQKELGELAKRENEQGFPLLLAQSLVGLWGALEVAIEDTLVSFLMYEPQLMAKEEFSSLKIPLAEFQLLDDEERARLLVADLERKLGASRRYGVDVFERLLSPAGLGGIVAEATNKSIREWHGVRNVIVHRGSIVDRRLVEACPWLDLKVGEHIAVEYTTLSRYRDAGWDYMQTILNRLGQRSSSDNFRE